MSVGSRSNLDHKSPAVPTSCEYGSLTCLQGALYSRRNKEERNYKNYLKFLKWTAAT